ncbi:uncharacterized protein METZ01_LOCUS466676, partial [marine metagenome]
MTDSLSNSRTRIMDSETENPPPLIRELSENVGDFTVSLHYDQRLYRQDIRGSIAHANMLANQGIITVSEKDDICSGLDAIKGEIESGSFPWREELEDIHMNIERRLYDKIGPSAGKLHTARSRNDQVCLDMRMYLREATEHTITKIGMLQNSL